MLGSDPKVEVERWRKRMKRMAPHYLLQTVPSGEAVRYLLAFTARGAARAAWLRTPSMVHMAMVPVAAQRSGDPRNIWRGAPSAWAGVDEDAVWAALSTLAVGGAPALPTIDVWRLPMMGRDRVVYPEVTHG